MTAGALAASGARVAWDSRGRIMELDDVPTREVALVLGARAYPSGPSSILAARLELAIELYRRGKVRRLLMSGDGLPRSHFEPAVMRRYVVERGVPAADVVEDPGGLDTYDSCVRALRIFGLRELTVVSQRFHLPRAIAICRRIGIDAVGVGDRSIAERFPRVYAKGWVREQIANLKMERDTLLRRRPRLGP